MLVGEGFRGRGTGIAPSVDVARTGKTKGREIAGLRTQGRGHHDGAWTSPDWGMGQVQAVCGGRGWALCQVALV